VRPEESLRGDLGPGVQGDWVERRSFVQRRVAGAVDRASAREHELADAGAFCDLGDRSGGSQVDVDGELLVDGAGRVTDQPAQMHDLVNSAHGFDEHVDMAEVGLDELAVRMAQRLLDRIAPVHHDVQDAHATSLGEQVGHESRTDVTGAADHQDGARLCRPCASRAYRVIARRDDRTPCRCPDACVQQAQPREEPARHEDAAR
jgi:hypothetical protein